VTKSCHCLNSPGTYVDGPFSSYDADPLAAVLIYAGCNPDFCTCAKDPEKELDSRPRELSTILDVCPRGQIDRCLCHDNQVVHFPFDMQEFLFRCRPKKCKCSDSKRPLPITGFGCAGGGFPYCRAAKDDFFCQDGQQLTQMHFVRAQFEGRTGCICGDGKTPLCRSEGNPPRCPDGSKIDLALGKPRSQLTECDGFLSL